MHVSLNNARTANLLGALSLAITDLTTAAVDGVTGLGGSAPAAVITVATRPGISIESLRRILGLSQPAAVRVVDRLVTAELITREAGTDARTVALRLTPSGRRRARAILTARHRAAETIVATLSERDRDDLDRLLARMLSSLPTNRDDARHLCRLCDQPACEAPQCPVDAAAPPPPIVPAGSTRA